MDEERAGQVVEELRARGVFAHVHHSGVYQFGIRVVIPDGREAIWDNDGAAGLEAVILEDGELVGFVPTIPGSEDADVTETVRLIAAADYDAPTEEATAAQPTAAQPVVADTSTPPRAQPAAARPDHRPGSTLLRRLTGR